MKKVLVVGATSAIAQSVSRLLALGGASFFLVGRNRERLQIVRDDLLARGAVKVGYQVLDFGKTELYERVVAEAIQELGGLSVLLVAHGSLTDQARAQIDLEYFKEQFFANFLSAAVFVTIVANRFQNQREGKIVVLGSVAGDRGRQSNYAYGTAKNALSTFMQGLRGRLAGSGVQALLVKPGFVDTPMTSHLEKNALYASPERVGKDIVRAMTSNRSIVYSPWYWRYIMLVIKLLPEVVFNRLKL